MGREETSERERERGWRYRCRLVVGSGDGSSERSTLWPESMVLVGGGRWEARGQI
jgi:hypothetical protein